MLAKLARSAESSEREIHEDEDLERRVRIFLHSSNRPGLRRLSVTARGGTITVSGPVQTFYERQLAVSFCQHVSGVRRVVDNLSVDVHGTDRWDR